MVNITINAIEHSIWSSTCPGPIYGVSTGSQHVPFWEGVREGTLDAHRTGWIIAGSFAAINTLFSLTLITLHLLHYTRPEFQRYYVRLILMIPVYSLISFFGYRYYSESAYFSLSLAFYESIVVASFFILILNFMGTKKREILSRGRRMRLMPPICCFTFYTTSWYFLELIKWCVLQYVIVQPILSITGAVLNATGHLCESSFSLRFGNSWLKIIEFISVTLATFALIQFYLVIRRDIADYQPLWKFIAIKLIIFLSFYQTLLLTILGYFGVIKATEYWSIDNITFGVNALAITIEMFLFCFLDAYAFSYRPFREGEKISFWRAVGDAFNVMDLVYEVGRNIRWIYRALILRRPELRDTSDSRFDIHNLHGRKTLIHKETELLYA